MLYKFRFISVPLLASYKHKNKVTILRTLTTLIKLELVEKQYNPSYRIQGKPARYYLSNKGLKYLRDSHDLNDSVLHAYYKNKSVTEDFAGHQLQVMAISTALKQQYPGVFHSYTKAEIWSDDQFPEAKPDLYLNFKNNTTSNGSSDYFVEVHINTPLYLIKKRLRQLVEHYDDGDWPSQPYPTLLFILGDPRTENNFAHAATKILHDQGMEEELNIWTTTHKALTVEPNTAQIWTSVVAPEILLGLD